MKDLSTPLMDAAIERHRAFYRKALRGEFDPDSFEGRIGQLHRDLGIASLEGWYIREMLRDLDAELSAIF